jgi:acyl carrier protein
MTLEERLAEIFDKAFGLEKNKFSLNLAPEEVSNWDSIGHMNMVMELEKEFGQQFEVDEIMEMSSTAKIAEILRAKGVQDS